MPDLQLPGTLAVVARAGADNAAAMLARWLRQPVAAAATTAEMVGIDLIPETVGADDQATIMLAARVKGALPGHTVAHLAHRDAAVLVACLGGALPPERALGTLGEMERSMLQETANILFSSFMNGMASALGLFAIPYAPAVRVDFGTAAWASILLEAAEAADEALVVTARLAGPADAGGPRIRLIFLADAEALALLRGQAAP